MAVVVAIGNVKGGTGKTTLTINVGYELAHRGYKVLLVDLDYQANLSRFFLGSVAYNSLSGTIKEAMDGQVEIEDVIVEEVRGNIDLIPSGKSLQLFELPIQSTTISSRKKALIEKTSMLLNTLAPLFAERAYDFVLIDTHPEAGLLLWNALYASDVVISPISDPDSVDGLSALVGELMAVNELQRRTELPLTEFKGVILNRVQKNRKATRNLFAKLKMDLPHVPVLGIIPERADVINARWEGLPLYEYLKEVKRVRNPENTDIIRAFSSIADRLVEIEEQLRG